MDKGLYKYVDKKGEIIYIGMSCNSIISRIKDHQREERFSPFLNDCTIFYAHMDNDDQIKWMEKLLIYKYKPVINSVDKRIGCDIPVEFSEPNWSPIINHPHYKNTQKKQVKAMHHQSAKKNSYAGLDDGGPLSFVCEDYMNYFESSNEYFINSKLDYSHANRDFNSFEDIWSIWKAYENHEHIPLPPGGIAFGAMLNGCGASPILIGSNISNFFGDTNLFGDMFGDVSISLRAYEHDVMIVMPFIKLEFNRVKYKIMRTNFSATLGDERSGTALKKVMRERCIPIPSWDDLCASWNKFVNSRTDLSYLDLNNAYSDSHQIIYTVKKEEIA